MEGLRGRARFSNTMPLPPNNTTSGEMLLSVVAPVGQTDSYEKLAPSSRVFQRIQGTLTEIDKVALVEKLRAADRPIRFHR
jgi:hypothetical protein